MTDAPATVGEGARITGYSIDTIRKRFDRGELTGVRTASGLRLIDRQALERLAAERAQKVEHRGW
jgi:hypothetical protein